MSTAFTGNGSVSIAAYICAQPWSSTGPVATGEAAGRRHLDRLASGKRDRQADHETATAELQSSREASVRSKPDPFDYMMVRHESWLVVGGGPASANAARSLSSESSLAIA